MEDLTIKKSHLHEPPPGLTIDPVGPGDAELLARLAQECARSMGGAKSLMDERAALRDVVAPDTVISGLMARMAGEPAGYVLHHPGYDPVDAAWGAHIVGFYVRRARRGWGVADAMLREVALEVASRGGDRIWIRVAEDNPRAARFVQRHIRVVEAGPTFLAVDEEFAALLE